MTPTLGEIFEGRWKAVSYNSKDNSYEFENIFNHQTIVIASAGVSRIKRGETTIAQIMRKRVFGTCTKRTQQRCKNLYRGHVIRKGDIL